MRAGSHPAEVGWAEKPYPGSEGSTRSNASAASPPCVAGSVSGPTTSSSSITEPGQPCVIISGSAFACPDFTWMKWMSSPSISVLNWGSAFSFASHRRQSCSLAQYRASSLTVALCTPCDRSVTSSLLGKRAPAMRRRRSSRASAEVSTVNGRTVMAPASSSHGVPRTRETPGLHPGPRAATGRLACSSSGAHHALFQAPAACRFPPAAHGRAASHACAGARAPPTTRPGTSRGSGRTARQLLLEAATPRTGAASVAEPS